MYPRAVRERYGAEVLDLLVQSTTPARDLLDVAWCALLDQGDLVTMSQLRARTPRLLGLLAAPLAFGAALLAIASFAVLFVGMVDAGAAPSTVELATAAAVVPVGVAAVWLGLRAGGRTGVALPQLVVPTVLALGTVVLASVPVVGQALGERWSAAVLATLLWCVMVIGLSIVGVRMTRRLPAWAATVLLVVGAVTVLELTFIAYALAVPAAYSPDAAPAYWYPAAVTGIDLGGVGSSTASFELLKGLPAVLTVCTAFALAFVTAAARRQRTFSAIDIAEGSTSPTGESLPG
jgi:hypothetical protein